LPLAYINPISTRWYKFRFAFWCYV